MPTYSNNILSVTIAELEQCGLSANYLNRALTGQRKGEVYCWEHHKVGKKIFIHYESLLDKYKTLIRNFLCGGVEPIVFIKTKEVEKAQAPLDAIADQLQGLVTTDADELQTLMKTGLYSPTEAHQLARAAGWLRLLNEYDVRRVRSLGYKCIDEFRQAVFKHCLNEQSSNPALIRWKKGNLSNIRVLVERYAVEYKKQGIDSLIHRGIGNVNREKADAQVHAKLIQLASERVKYSFEDIAMMYNDWADEVGKPNMTTSAVKAYLNTPKIKKVWFYARHGKLSGDNELQTLIQREKPSFPDALWSIDGTSSQLYYLDEKGKIQSDLYIYFVTDACTGAIIGHSVAFAETAQMVTEALKNAVDTHENKPYQVQYDNSSANIAFATQAMISNMSRVHFPCEPYKGRSKYVESIIGHFQQRVLRKDKSFKGGNVNVKSLNSVANPELLKELAKNPEQLYTREGAIVAIAEAVSEWNKRGEKRNNYGRFVGESKIQRYTTVQHEKRTKLNYFDRISLFVAELPKLYAYTTQGVKLELNKQKYNFIVPDPDSVGDFIFANEHLGEKFTVRINGENPNMITLLQNGVVVAHAYEKERYAACVADLKDGEKAKQVLFKNKQEQYGVQYSISELERQMVILSELQPTGTDGFGWQDRPKYVHNVIERKQEDTRNGMDDGLSEVERKLMKIGR